MWTEMMDDENQNHNQSQTNSRTQDPPNRPEVSAVTGRNVYRAIMDLRLASTDDLVRHDIVDRSKRQVQRALDKAQDKDLINYVRDGRRVLYYIAPEFLTKEEKDQYGL